MPFTATFSTLRMMLSDTVPFFAHTVTVVSPGFLTLTMPVAPISATSVSLLSHMTVLSVALAGFITAVSLKLSPGLGFPLTDVLSISTLSTSIFSSMTLMVMEA